MAKLFTGNQVETMATQEWVDARGGGSSSGGTCECSANEPGADSGVAPLDSVTINQILTQTGFPTIT
jgi:hypothetical protein